jgi:coenzyme PQQ precursor peptide PqqA
MAIREAYASYKEIRLEVIMCGKDSETVEPGSRIPGSQNTFGRSGRAWPQLAEGEMREWHKPTIEETESGMEVTSYLPAELDRA